MKKKIIIVFLFLMATFTFVICSCGNTETPDISGEYQDEISQRASMTLTKREDSNTYDALISWSTSSDEIVEWAFSGDFDGEKIEYSNGICKEYKTAKDGDVKEKLRDGEYNGTLTMIEDKIEWSGSNDGETAMFVLIPEIEQE